MSQKYTLQRPYGSHQRIETQQAVQAPGGKGIQVMGESTHYPSHRRTTKPDREFSDSFSLTRSKPPRLPSGFTPFRHQHISDQESSFFTIPGIFKQKTRIKREKNTSFNNRQKESDSMILNLLDLVKEVNKSQK
ncbi:hypothetical protein O181_103069 [Austropuccinia psidii MF-1]|uniref:Uncharacterized protein n=1 Tax=Austropuccinia psidii MF-1 TaxID=1389203 RepID=A0A9Q3JJR2_9BASI|nr:hypothetical protein [Austropuccinia psidii MF-1]